MLDSANLIRFYARFCVFGRFCARFCVFARNSAIFCCCKINFDLPKQYIT
ncbi:hypothetical protein [Helicobacter sp. 23-1045]